MKGRYLIGIALALLVCGILVLAYLFITMNSSTEPLIPGQPQGSNPFGFSVGTDGNPVETRTIIAGGESIAVPDFTKGKPSVPVSDAPQDLQYDLTPYPDYEPGAPYPTHSFDVQFNQKDSQFVVTLNEEPLGASRLAAELFLKQQLELTETQLCTLTILVGVPYSVNQSFSSYQNLGLSFCAGSMQLPS